MVIMASTIRTHLNYIHMPTTSNTTRVQNKSLEFVYYRDQDFSKYFVYLLKIHNKYIERLSRRRIDCQNLIKLTILVIYNQKHMLGVSIICTNSSFEFIH